MVTQGFFSGDPERRTSSSLSSRQRAAEMDSAGCLLLPRSPFSHTRPPGSALWKQGQLPASSGPHHPGGMNSAATLAQGPGASLSTEHLNLLRSWRTLVSALLSKTLERSWTMSQPHIITIMCSEKHSLLLLFSPDGRQETQDNQNQEKAVMSPPRAAHSHRK